MTRAGKKPRFLKKMFKFFLGFKVFFSFFLLGVSV